LAWIFGSTAMDSHAYLRELVDSQYVIADFVKECDQRLRARETQPDNSVSLEKLLQNSPPADAPSQTMLFVLQSGLARLWQSWGIQPDAACGFGVGQYAAACVAGGLDFLDALVLVYEWEMIRNQPECGEAAWEAFEELADQFNFYPPDLPLVCSVSGSIVAVHRSLGGSYWRQHATAEPNLNASIEALNSIDFDAGLVLGSEADNRPLLSRLEKGNVKVLNCGMTAPGMAAPALIATLARLYESGCNPDFRSVYGSQPRQKLSLPTYPFQKKRYWITEISQFMKTEETAERECVHS
jgi:acyl transferase domain-containing protein